MRDVEEAGTRTDSVVFRDDSPVLDGHLPTREFDHPGPEVPVGNVEGGAQKRRCQRGGLHDHETGCVGVSR